MQKSALTTAGLQPTQQPTRASSSLQPMAARKEDQCGLNIGRPGDVLCLKPPAEHEGFQVRLGSSDYDDAAEVDKYLLQPGEEVTACMCFRTPNEREATAAHSSWRRAT